MPTWECTQTEITKEQAEESLSRVKSACFGCASHSPECAIAKAAGAISSMIQE